MTHKEKPHPGATNTRNGANINLCPASLTPIDSVLNLLDRVHQTAPTRWLAACPGSLHQRGDRNRSLSLAEGREGAVLVHCFAGCSPADIVAAIGLELADLFPRRDPNPFNPGGHVKRERFRPAELIELAAFEALVVAVAATDLCKGKKLDAAALARVRVAETCLYGIAREVSHGHR